MDAQLYVVELNVVLILERCQETASAQFFHARVQSEGLLRYVKRHHVMLLDHLQYGLQVRLVAIPE